MDVPWKAVAKQVHHEQGRNKEIAPCRHLRDLLRDTARSDYLFKEHNQILADFSRQRMTKDTVQKLLALAKKAKLPEKIEAMFTGEHINVTEDRPVLHVALRAPREQVRFL